MFIPISFTAGSIKTEDKAYKTAHIFWMIFKHSANHSMDII